ncbi:MAG: glutathione S-transferase family protein [Gloeomargarita sp. SKYB31]|nr:glutathione S-transferase family protein [Gloeomargarita sp. SKYB31]
MVLQLYDYALSGNCYKVRLLLSFLKLPYQTIPINLNSRENQQATFLRVNPFGQVPVLVDEGLILRDSLAIMVYLVKQYANPDQEFWLPDEPSVIAKMLSWASVANHELQNTLAQLRRHYLFGQKADVVALESQAYKVLAIIEQHLENSPWLVGHYPTIADIACFPYIGLAPDARISLEKYRHLRRWLRDFQSLDGYVNMSGMPTY